MRISDWSSDVCSSDLTRSWPPSARPWTRPWPGWPTPAAPRWPDRAVPGSPQGAREGYPSGGFLWRFDAAHWPLWPISWTPLWVYLLLCRVPDCVPGRRGRTASGGTASGKTGPGRTCPGRTGRRPVGPGEIGRMDFERFFAKEMAGLKAEGRYRIFADLERRAGAFPHAMRHRSEEHTSELQSL